MRWKAKVLEQIVNIIEVQVTLGDAIDGMVKVMQAAEMRIDDLDPDSKRSAVSRRWLAGELLMIQDRLIALEHHAGLDGNEELMIERMKQVPDPLEADEAL